MAPASRRIATISALTLFGISAAWVSGTYLNVEQVKRHFVLAIKRFKDKNKAILFVMFESIACLDKNIGALTSQVTNDDIGRSISFLHAVVDRKFAAPFCSHIDQLQSNTMIPFESSLRTQLFA